MRIRGMHDINTHGTLARAGILISVARDFHRTQETNPETSSWNGNVSQYVWKKEKQMSDNGRPFRKQITRKRQLLDVERRQLERLRGDLAEIDQWVAEGLPGAAKIAAQIRSFLLKIIGEEEKDN